MIAAVFAMAVSCGTVIAGISFEEGIPAFRRGVDAWRAESGVRGKWTDLGFEVVASGCSDLTIKYDRYPGMEPFRGADEIVLSMKSDHINEILCCKFSQIPLIMYNSIIYRNSSNHCRTFST
jgi:hypothetical protein